MLSNEQSFPSLQVSSVSWADLFAKSLIEMIQTAPLIIKDASRPIVSVIERPESVIQVTTSKMLPKKQYEIKDNEF